MAVWNVVNLSFVNSKKRIDADFYKKEYVALDLFVDCGLRIDQISRTVDLQSNGAFKVIFNILNDGNKKTIPYIRSGNVGDYFVNKDDLHFISEEAHNKLTKTITQYDDILMARKGKIGGATIILEDDINFNSNDNVVNVRLFDTRFNPKYFVAFWNSKYGLKQVERLATGNVQPWLSMKQVRELKTVLLDESKQLLVAELVENSYKLLKQSQTLYKEAEELLEKELGLDGLEFEKPRSYTAKLSEVSTSRRNDAEFFNPHLKYYYHNLEKNNQMIELNTIAQVIKFENPPYSISNEIPIITQKHLKEITPKDYHQGIYTSENWTKKVPSAILNFGDLLFYSVGAYLGKTNIWLNSDKAVPASFITLIRPIIKEDSFYLYLLLNSKFGLLQSKVFQSGTSQQYIYPKDIRKFKIPMINQSIKIKIEKLILESHESQEQSKQLLEDAKAKVEALIEEATR